MVEAAQSVEFLASTPCHTHFSQAQLLENNVFDAIYSTVLAWNYTDSVSDLCSNQSKICTRVYISSAPVWQGKTCLPTAHRHTRCAVNNSNVGKLVRPTVDVMVLLYLLIAAKG